MVVTGGPLQLSGAGLDGSGLPLQIALQKSGDYDLITGETVLYRPPPLCGLGPKCAIAKGKASTQRHLLLRRESLELSLYTFRYVKGISNVVVFMPPKLGSDPSEALFFRKGDVSPELGKPLSRTLPGQAAAAELGRQGAGLVVHRQVHDDPPVLVQPDAGQPGQQRVPGAGAVQRKLSPRQSSTGSRGYFGNDGSVFARSHSENAEPRVLPTTRWCTQRSHRPAGGR